jgi:hypothetical protein
MADGFFMENRVSCDIRRRLYLWVYLTAEFLGVIPVTSCRKDSCPSCLSNPGQHTVHQHEREKPCAKRPAKTGKERVAGHER